MKNKLITLSGILGFIFGVIALITVSLHPAKTLFISVIAGASLVLLSTFFIFHYESFRAFSKKRSTQFGLNSIMMIVLFVFIVVVLNLILRQYYLRLDMSSTLQYSLAPQTVNFVRNLRSEIKITVFGQETSPTFKKAMELLEGYRYLNRNVLYLVVDLDRVPLLAKEYGVSQYDSVVVKAEGTPVIVQEISEEAITNAIIKATRKSREKIYFMAGHGEKDMRDSGRGGMSKAVQKLLAIGYEVMPLTLSSLEAVPGDADLLLIAGPSESFSTDDIEKIHDYMTQGGRLIALFDPGYDASEIIGSAGMRLINASVIDPSSNLGGKNDNVPLVTNYPESPVTRDFKLTTVYPGVAPLEIGGLEMTFDYFKIITTSPESRLVENGNILPEKEGNYVIAAAAGSKQGKDIVMAFGDSDFASNAFFDAVGNGNLFLNSVNWIAAHGELISITPRKEDFIPLYLTPEQSKAISYVSVAAIPLCVFGGGMFIWWRRKRL